MSEALFEAETQINFNEGSDTATVYTASSRVAKLLKRRGIEPVRVDRDDKGKERSWFFEVSKWAVMLKPANRLVKIGGRKINASAVETQEDAQNGDIS